MSLSDGRGQNVFSNVWEHGYNLVIRWLPTRFGKRLRVWWLRQGGAQIGSAVIIGEGVRVLGMHYLQIGKDATIARDVCLDARGGLELREGALIGFESVILTSTHNHGDPERLVQDQGFHSARVIIGEGAWLGARTFVLPGVEIGRSTVVGVGAVVLASTPDHVVMAGVPARVVRHR